MTCFYVLKTFLNSFTLSNKILNMSLFTSDGLSGGVVTWARKGIYTHYYLLIHVFLFDNGFNSRLILLMTH